ncbi:hypothetical protein [Methylophilus luteus]|uniref:PEP-CTERM protein-sorting domain-containing protein n=1 Tax=Methylophilus luteus TaxID=640108 RepID=A0ABW3F9Y4_9PROT
MFFGMPLAFPDESLRIKMQVVRHSQTSGSHKADKNYHLLTADTSLPDAETDGMLLLGLGLMDTIAMRRQKNC